MSKIQKLTLPEFAFLDDQVSDSAGELDGRVIILHVRSASVVEIFDREDVVLNDGVLTHRFIYTNKLGIEERKLIALHYSATLDVHTDPAFLKEQVLIPAAKWYCSYCEWEDSNILD